MEDEGSVNRPGETVPSWRIPPFLVSPADNDRKVRAVVLAGVRGIAA